MYKMMEVFLNGGLPFGILLGYQLQKEGTFTKEIHQGLTYAIPEPFHEVAGALGKDILQLLKPYKLTDG